MTDTLPRPRQVTMAAWMAMGASVLVVLTVFETVAGLNTLETREAVEKFLSEPPGGDLGLDVEGALAVIRVLAMVAAGCATAAAVFGYHVLKRSKGARLALTVVAVPLFFAGMVVGGFLSSLVAASALVLWLEPSRDWFNGVRARSAGEGRAAVPPAPPAPSAPPAHEAGPAAPPSSPPAPPVSGPPVEPGVPSTGPRAHLGFGTPQHHPVGSPPPGWTPYPTRPELASRAAGAPRPGAVLAACVVTWTLATLVAGMMLLTAVVTAAAPELLLDELHRQNPDLAEQGLDDQAVQVAVYVITAVTCLWALLAIVLAVLVHRGVAWARTALLLSAGAAGIVSAVGALSSLLMVVPAIGCAVTVSLLLRPEVRAWFARGPMQP